MIPVHIVHRYFPDVLYENARLYISIADGSGMLKNTFVSHVIRCKRCNTGLLAWFRVGSYLAPYVWSKKHSCWFRSTVDLYFGIHKPKKTLKLLLPVARFNIPVTFPVDAIPQSRRLPWKKGKK